MKIFIWNAYGNIDVYDATTVESLKKLYDTIKEILSNYGVDDEIDLIDDRLNSRFQDDEWVGKHELAYIRAINSLLELTGMRSGDDDNFELGTGFSTLK